MGAGRTEVLLRELATLGLFLLPTALMLVLGGPSEMLHFNGLSTHDGIRYFEVSLDPLGAHRYCPERFRYSRALFPATVFLTSNALACGLRGVGLGDWLNDTFRLDGHELPNVVLLHACVYHFLLVLVSWLALRLVSRFLRSWPVAVLLMAVLLQVVLFKGLLTPLDIALATLCVRAIRSWTHGPGPTWGRALALSRLFSAALLDREVFLLLLPILAACHFARHGRRHSARLAAVLGLGLLAPVAWYLAVSLAQGESLPAAVVGWVGDNSSGWPLAHHLRCFGGPSDGHALALLPFTVYAVFAAVRLGWKEWHSYREGRGLSAERLWSLAVLLLFLRASPLLLDTTFNYGRLLLLAPALLRDATRVYVRLDARWGRAFRAGLGGLATAALLVLLWYQATMYPDHLVERDRRTGFLAESWLGQMSLQPSVYTAVVGTRPREPS
jgi:hypothetical protein